MDLIDVQGVQAALMKQMGAYDSIEVHVRLKAELLVAMAGAKPNWGMRSETYREAGPQRRWYSDVELGEDGTPPESVGFGCLKGDLSATVSPASPSRGLPRSITLGRDFLGEKARGFSIKPKFLMFRDVGLTPLHEAILRATRAGTDTVCGRSCTVYHFPGVAGARSTQTLVYALDDETAVPLRVTAYRDAEAIERGRPNWEWVTLELGSVGDLSYAKESRHTSYTFEEGRLVPRIVETHVVERVELDKSFKETDFWPVFRPGDYVDDLIARKDYHIGPNGKPLVRPPQATATAVQDPVQAIESEGANDLFWSLTGLWTACALITCGIALKLRARKA
ncbi:MAG: hypothetical protein AB7I30_22090 [Isosphaeraceae bacterium]